MSNLNKKSLKSFNVAQKAKTASKMSHSENLRRHIRELASKQTLAYIEHAVDPKNIAPAPRPNDSTTYNGRVGMTRMKAVSTLYIGANGVGFAVYDPYNSAGCSDRLLGYVTNNTFVGTLSQAITTAQPPGTNAVYPANTGYTGAGLGLSNDGTAYAACVNACGIYIKPTGSAVSQDGMIYLLETPLHPENNGTTTLAQIVNHPNTRSVAGNQVGTPGFENCLNWHPQPGLATGFTSLPAESDSEYMAPIQSAVALTRAPLIIVVTGTAGASYSIEAHGSWMRRGLLADANIPNFCDALGMEMFFNSLLYSATSGWVGHPEDAVTSYHAALFKAADLTKPAAQKEREKAQAVVQAEKPTKSLITLAQEAYDFLKPVARDLAGFFL